MKYQHTIILREVDDTYISLFFSQFAANVEEATRGSGLQEGLKSSWWLQSDPDGLARCTQMRRKQETVVRVRV